MGIRYDNAKDYLPFIQAMAEGKIIQVKDRNRWVDFGKNAGDISFFSNPENYRVKPDPVIIECFANMYSDGAIGSPHSSINDCNATYELTGSSSRTGVLKVTFQDGEPTSSEIIKV